MLGQVQENSLGPGDQVFVHKAEEAKQAIYKIWESTSQRALQLQK